MLKLRSLLIGNLLAVLGPKIIKSKIFWVLCLGLVGVSYQFFQHMKLVRSEPITVWSTNTTADCAVVLTGGAGRLREGFDLLSQKQIKKLIVSGVNASSSLSDIFPLWVFYPEIKEEDIFLERRSETTYGNAQQSLPLVEALNCHDVILVTSNLHMYRAFRTFRNIFPPQIELVKQALPTAHRVHLSFWDVVIESFKSMFYALWAYGPVTAL